MSASAEVAGLYGKVPAKADFVHRNLPNAFVRPWDEWLSRCLAASRATLGGRWTELYLSGPVWRFAAEPGVLGPSGWGGVMATSVDAVNRFFPLTIAVPVGDDALASQVNAGLGAWLPRLEDMALDVIEGAVDIERAAGEARQIAGELLHGRTGPGHYIWQDVRGEPRGWLALTPGMPTPLVPAPGRVREPLTYWWRTPWNGEPAAGLACPGLPSTEIFTAFLTGRWVESGWRAVESGGAVQ